MLLEGRHPRRAVFQVARENLVTAYDAVFHLVDPHQPTKLVGLMRFAFANHFGVGLEQAQHFALHVAVTAQHPFPGLGHHLLHQREKVPKLANLPFHPQEFTHHFQASLPPSLHHFAGLSHHAPGQSKKKWELVFLKMAREANLQICHPLPLLSASIKGLSLGFRNSL
jgi:hypothetical protein